MCCFLNRCCNPQNHCCFLQNNQTPYFWQGNDFANTQANVANSFGQNYGLTNCCMPYFTFGNCCRHARVFANNFALDRPVSASFLHTPDYHHIAEIGF